MHQPTGFHDLITPDHVFLLKWSLYGLATWVWYHQFDRFITRYRFCNSKSDTSLFIYRQGDHIA